MQNPPDEQYLSKKEKWCFNEFRGVIKPACLLIISLLFLCFASCIVGCTFERITTTLKNGVPIPEFSWPQAVVMLGVIAGITTILTTATYCIFHCFRDD